MVCVFCERERERERLIQVYGKHKFITCPITIAILLCHNIGHHELLDFCHLLHGFSLRILELYPLDHIRFCLTHLVIGGSSIIGA